MKDHQLSVVADHAGFISLCKHMSARLVDLYEVCEYLFQQGVSRNGQAHCLLTCSLRFDHPQVT